MFRNSEWCSVIPGLPKVNLKVDNKDRGTFVTFEFTDGENGPDEMQTSTIRIYSLDECLCGSRKEKLGKWGRHLYHLRPVYI